MHVRIVCFNICLAVAEKEEVAPAANGAPEGTNPLAAAGGPGGAFDFSSMSGLLEVSVHKESNFKAFNGNLCHWHAPMPAPNAFVPV
jgi:hypothetical protein